MSGRAKLTRVRANREGGCPLEVTLGQGRAGQAQGTGVGLSCPSVSPQCSVAGWKLQAGGRAPKKEKGLQDFPGGQWLRFCFLMQGVQV